MSAMEPVYRVVDLQGDGQRLVFPHKVVQGSSEAATIIARPKERAKSAAKTRKAKGIRRSAECPSGEARNIDQRPARYSEVKVIGQGIPEGGGHGEQQVPRLW